MRLTCLLTLSLLLLSPAGELAAQAPPGPRGPNQGARTHFMGPHPISSQYGKGYCYLEFPHIHAYAPEHPALYQTVGDEYLFVGDPTPFGYEGPHTPWYGHHPVQIEVELEAAPPPIFCFIKGPHYHAYAPPPSPDYKLEGEVVFYMGVVPPDLEPVRVQREQALEIEYRPYVKLRPQVVVTPPPEWHGTLWVVAGPRAIVAGPSMGAVVVGPSLNVVLPSLSVSGPGVAIYGGSTVYVEGGKRRHHDNGRHLGWYKEGHGGNGKHGGKHGKGH